MAKPGHFGFIPFVYAAAKGLVQTAGVLENRPGKEIRRFLGKETGAELADTRTTRWAEGAYACEITEDDHYALLSALQRIEGMAIISGYPSDLYEECLADWSRYEHPSRTTNTSNVATEVIWVSPAAEAHGQRTLF